MLSALEVQNTSGGTDIPSINVGDTIFQPDVPGEPELEVIAVANTTANTDAVVLRVKPILSQLAIANSASWSFRQGDQVNIKGSNTVVGTLSGFVGRGASARLTTLTGGVVNEVNLIQGGTGYYVQPFVAVQSNITSSIALDTVEFVAENFTANVVSASVEDHAGFGYGLTVTEGVVYQKGHFIRVGTQSVIVDKYANTPNDVAVGFETREAIVNSAIDETLLDNSGGFLNRNAPGADRLDLIPQLKVLPTDQAEQDAEFFPFIRFSEGRPFITTETAAYNKIGDELARRTHDKAGNFVLDKFNITTRSTIDFADSSNTFSYIIDPGHAYVNGYRIKTDRNFAKNVPKGIETEVLTDSAQDIIYGNYVRVKELGGLTAFTTGSVLSLYSNTSNYFTNAVFDTIAEPSGKIGEARVRSVVYERGTVGTDTAIYRVYLFDIRMNAGRDFSQTKSVFKSGAVANIVLEKNPRNTTQDIAVLKETQQNSILFDTKYPAKSMDNLRYKYRSSVTGRTVGASASATQLTVAAESGAVWPYSGELSFAEKKELIVVPDDTLIIDPAIEGAASTANNTTVTGANTNFVADLKEGDHIQIGSDVARVTRIDSATQLQYIPTGRLNGLSGAIGKVYPKGVPIPLEDANAAIVSNELRINFNVDFQASNTATVAYNMQANNVAPASKEVRRNRFVKIEANTHPEGASGPWCLGISDVFRLRKVYAGANTSAPDVTSEFYIDHNQTENYYGLSYLYKKPTSRYQVGTDDELLIEFDHFESSQRGLKTITSYPIDDTKPLATIGANVHTMEIPEVLDRNSEFVDLREALDFRPIALNQANSVTDFTIADVNPSETLDFGTDNLKFPVPESDTFYRVEYYLGRTDTIVLNSDKIFDFKIGIVPRSNDPNEFLLYRAEIPPYPSLPRNLSLQMEEIIDTQVANESYTNNRRKRFTIQTEKVEEQTPVYTMRRISRLERRIEILEYYSNISLLEDQVKDLVIPSSLDATLERFKFGFFVDNFATSQFTEIESPEYNASIFEFKLQPARYRFNVSLRVAERSKKFVDGERLHFPFERRRLVSQTVATSGPFVSPEPPEPEIETVCQFVSNRGTKFDTSAEVFEENTFTLSSSSAADGLPITINFDMFSGIDRFEFYQSQNANGPFTLIGTHENFEPTNLSDSERVELRNLKLRRSDGTVLSWNNPNFSFRTGFSNNKFWIVNIGKITIPYDLSRGRFFKIRVVKGSATHAYRVCYPADGFAEAIFGEFAPIVLPPPPGLPDEPAPPPPPPEPVCTDPGEIIETFPGSGRCLFVKCSSVTPVPCPVVEPAPEPIVIPPPAPVEEPPPVIVEEPVDQEPDPGPDPEPYVEPPPPPPEPVRENYSSLTGIITGESGFLDLY